MEEKNIRYLLFFVMAAIVVVIGLGRMEFHNELERGEREGVFLGYLDEQNYSGTVTILETQWPAWTDHLDKKEKNNVTFAPGSGGRIGIFADLVYYENRFERRVWFTGKLRKRDAEYYYRQEGLLQLQPVYEKREPDIDLKQLKGNDYDYTGFCGTA